MNFNTINPDTVLYVHYPFCSSLCHFCIYKNRVFNGELSKQYLASLAKEALLYEKNVLNGYKFKNIHIGGGTPNLISADELIRPFERLIDLENVERFVIEIIPRANLNLFIEDARKYGIKKLQIGIQTTNDRILKIENRDSSSKMIFESMESLAKSGLLWSVDLISGFKDELRTPRAIVEELESILKFKPTGVHLYSMRATAKNGFYNQQNRTEGHAKTDLEILKQTMLTLNRNGYKYVKDEWCLQENIDAANLTVCFNHKTGFPSDVMAIGATAVSRTRKFSSINVSSIEDYCRLTDLDEFPQQEILDYLSSGCYPIEIFRHEIGMHKVFNLDLFLKSFELSNFEKNILKEFIELLRTNIILEECNGIIAVAPESYPLFMTLANKFLEKNIGKIIHNE